MLADKRSPYLLGLPDREHFFRHDWRILEWEYRCSEGEPPGTPDSTYATSILMAGARCPRTGFSEAQFRERVLGQQV